MRRPSEQLGHIIRQQRQHYRLTLREFATMAGISNPYLSQIERGLREPSRTVVDAIARSLQTSAEALYEQAGLPADADDARARIDAAVQADAGLSPRQRRVLMDVYDAMVAAGPVPRAGRRKP